MVFVVRRTDTREWLAVHENNYKATQHALYASLKGPVEIVEVTGDEASDRPYGAAEFRPAVDGG